LISAVFVAFLVAPLVNTSVDIATDEFAKLGFEFGSLSKGAFYFGGMMDARVWVISDITSKDGLSFHFEVHCLDQAQEPKLLGPSDLHKLLKLGLYR